MMLNALKHQHYWVFCTAALAVWFALGWPFLQEFLAGTSLRGFHVPALWFAPFALFGAAVLASILLKLRTSFQLVLLCVQLAAVVAMAIVVPSDLVSVFLIIIAWQVAVATTSSKALGWITLQTLAIVGVLAQARSSDLSYILGLSFVLQLSMIVIAHALRRQAQATRALAQANRELRSAQAIIANTIRDEERLRISRELHDAWGHELTALGLQLEIASHIIEPGRAGDYVTQAKGLSRALLVKVRDVVAALRQAERSDSKVAIGVKHSETLDLRLQLNSDDEDVRPVTQDNSSAEPTSSSGSTSEVAGYRPGNRNHWIFCVAALAVWVALGWPVIQNFVAGTMIRGAPVSALWFVPFTLFGAAILIAMVLKLPTRLHWMLLYLQLAAVAAMAFVASWALMSAFLVIIAWQVAVATGFYKTLAWVTFQTLTIIAVLALAPNPDLCWLIGKSFALQLFAVCPAQALRKEAETARALAQTNMELRAAQAIVAGKVRDAERLRISRELHDAWGHELTALGLQLELASHVAKSEKAHKHVMQAKGLVRSLLVKVRDVVATLREAEGCDLKDALEALAHSIPKPAIHVEMAPGLRIRPDEAHALMRCAQEAVTNAVKHAEATNLWLQVTVDSEGVRLVAQNDGNTRPTASSPGSGLLGMRERVEALGGKLAVRTGGDFGFTVDAWLPSRAPQAA